MEKIDVKTVLVIIGMIVSGLGSYFAMSTRVSVLETKNEFQVQMLQSQGTIIKDNTRVLQDLKVILAQINGEYLHGPTNP